MTSAHPVLKETIPLHLRAPHTSGSTSLSPQGTPYLREHPLHPIPQGASPSIPETPSPTPQGTPYLRETPHTHTSMSTPFTSGHPTPEGAPLIHLRVPNTPGSTSHLRQDPLLHRDHPPSPQGPFPSRGPAVPAARAAPHAGPGWRSPAVKQDRKSVV